MAAVHLGRGTAKLFACCIHVQQPQTDGYQFEVPIESPAIDRINKNREVVSTSQERACAQ